MIMPGCIVVPVKVKHKDINDPKTSVRIPNKDVKIPVQVFIHFDNYLTTVKEGDKLVQEYIGPQEYGSVIMIPYNRKDTDEDIIKKVKDTEEYAGMITAFHLTDNTDPEKVHITIVPAVGYYQSEKWK